MALWIIMFISLIICPIIMIGFGHNFLKGGPKDINDWVGYRTKLSRKNKDTWQFAHRHVGKFWYYPGWVMLVLTLAIMFILLGKDEDTLGAWTGIFMMVQCIYLCGTIFPVEIALRKTFNSDGTRKDGRKE